jgi:hypothetical protein
VCWTWGARHTTYEDAWSVGFMQTLETHAFDLVVFVVSKMNNWPGEITACEAGVGPAELLLEVLGMHLQLYCHRNCVCVFITAGPSTKLFTWGGGGCGRTCATRDDEPRPVWTSLPITY